MSQDREDRLANDIGYWSVEMGPATFGAWVNMSYSRISNVINSIGNVQEGRHHRS
jgi:hypothetical protein